MFETAVSCDTLENRERERRHETIIEGTQRRWHSRLRINIDSINFLYDINRVEDDKNSIKSNV